MHRESHHPNAIGLQGYVIAEFKGPNGVSLRRDTFGNLIMDAGRVYAAQMLGGVSTVPFQWIAVGSATASANATQTALLSEITDGGLARVQDGTPTNTSVTLQIDQAWTATAANTVNEVALLNSSADGVMLARQTCGPYAFASGNQFAVTWNIECKSSA